MKKKTLCRALAALCLISALAACGREGPPPETTPAAAVSSAVPEPDAQETRAECLRLISNCLEQNKSRIEMWEILSLDREEFFSDYTGGESQVVRYEPIPGRIENSTAVTNDVYYWHDESGEATPQQAARELVGVMLEHLKSLPEDERTFTLTEYSVKEQPVCGWEDLPEMIMGMRSYSIDGLSYDEAVGATKERLAREAQSPQPFIYAGFVYAMGEDMWSLDPNLTFDYEGLINMYRRDEAEDAGLAADDGLLMEYQQGSENIFVHIIMRDGDVWRMQRAEAMEKMFADTPFIRRMEGYSLNQLENSMTNRSDPGMYIEDAEKEYLRRAALDPEGMAARMDSLGFPRLAHVCSALAAEGEAAECLASVKDSYSAQLLGKYMELEKGLNGEAKRPLPPAVGIICPAMLYEGIRAGVGPEVDFVSGELLIFHDYSGLFAYDFRQEEIVFSADFLTAMGWTGTQGSYIVSPVVDADGGRIRLTYLEESWDHCLVRYEIDTSDWSWESVNYELDDPGDIFVWDYGRGGHGEFRCRTKDGEDSMLLRDLVYLRGDEALRVFDGVDFNARTAGAPVPSKYLEQSVHNAIMALGADYGDFECEAHETLGVDTMANGAVKCYLAVERGGYSCSGESIVQGSGSRTYCALSFTPDENGYYVFTEKDGINGPWGEEITRIFPERLRGRIGDAEMENALSQSCISQAMDYFGLTPPDGEQT